MSGEEAKVYGLVDEVICPERRNNSIEKNTFYDNNQ